MKRYRVRLSRDANAKLLSIYRYIAREAGAGIAQRFTSAILDRCEALEFFPDRGTPREDLRPGLRTIAFRRRVVIAYKLFEDEVTVIGIYYGGENFEADMTDDA